MIAINQDIRQNAPLIIATALGLVVLMTTINDFRQWYSDWATTRLHETTAQAFNAKDETAEMIAAIPSEHLFGQKLAGSNMPITSLELRVTGIVKAAEGTESTSKAYISISGQPSKIYQVGDSLPYGVKVYEITADTIILENDGHLEKLPLPRDRLQFKNREMA